MRIIAGQRRGHRIDGPRASAHLQPTSDLVRESMFNIVGDLVVGRVAVDLFAGTGAIGLEALSRGAERAIFVERDREAVALIHRNVATLRYQDRAVIRLADAFRWARSCDGGGDIPLVVFLDPPYREYEVHASKLNQMLSSLSSGLPAGSMIVVEAAGILHERVLPDLDAWDVRRYGDTRLAFRTLKGDWPETDHQTGMEKEKQEDEASPTEEVADD